MHDQWHPLQEKQKLKPTEYPGVVLVDIYLSLFCFFLSLFIRVVTSANDEKCKQNLTTEPLIILLCGIYRRGKSFYTNPFIQTLLYNARLPGD